MGSPAISNLIALAILVATIIGGFFAMASKIRSKIDDAFAAANSRIDRAFESSDTKREALRLEIAANVTAVAAETVRQHEELRRESRDARHDMRNAMQLLSDQFNARLDRLLSRRNAGAE